MTEPSASLDHTSSVPAAAPAGWHPDPLQPGQQRYWDGTKWTEHVAPAQPTTAPGYPGSPGPSIPARRSNKATWALVMGILGLIVLPIVFSVLAIVFGVSARTEIDANPGMKGRGNATAGIVLGILGLVAGALILITVVGGA